ESDEIDLDLSVGGESLDIDLDDDLSGSIENETDGLIDDDLMDIDESTDEDSAGLDFDLGIDDDSNELAGLELDDSDESNDIGMESDVGSDADSDSIDLESTIQMPAAKVESLSMVDNDNDDDDDDKTFMVPKSTEVDEQSVDEEMASQLDLAKAYIELGDNENAKTILDEIIAQGSEDYRKQAEELISQIN
ncbi:MAG: FimV/HubP family polar landmark protein, partial [Gammaproteobacteria bacterium]